MRIVFAVGSTPNGQPAIFGDGEDPLVYGQLMAFEEGTMSHRPVNGMLTLYLSDIHRLEEENEWIIRYPCVPSNDPEEREAS